MIQARFFRVGRTGLVLAAAILPFLASAATAAILPNQVPGNVLWLDANDRSTVVQSGGFVSQWLDKSPLGANGFSQATSTYQPRTGLLTFNGNRVLTLDGVNDHLLGPAVLAGGDKDYTYWVVWRPKTTAAPNQSPYEQAGPGGSARSAILTYGASYGFNGEGNDVNLVPFAANVWRITALEVNDTPGFFDGTNNVRITDNGTTYLGRTGGAGNLNVGTAGSTIGKKQQVFSEFLNGDVSEVIVYNRILTATEKQDVGAYLTQKYLTPPAPGPGGLMHKWTFNDGTALDSVGGADGILYGNTTPSIANGKLVLNPGGDQNQYMTTANFGHSLGERTIMAWVGLSNLSQAGGAGVLGIQQAAGVDNFDSIVYAERKARQWMNGSSFWQRSNGADNGGADETTTNEVMMAIVYGVDNSITLYRNGQFYANSTSGSLVTRADPIAVLGRRVDLAGPSLQGSINEARVYNRAMSATEILAAWQAGIQPTGLIHQWTFNDGTARDSVGGAHGTLFNGAAVVNQDGRVGLQLDGINDYMRTSTIPNAIGEKTLVAWVKLSNLTQQSGGVLTLEDPTGSDVFDSITYGERTANQWMNGSNGWTRSGAANNGGALETSTGQVMLAIAYGPGGAIDIYRNGELYATYTTSGPINYPANIADVVLGVRHSDRIGETGGTPGGNDPFLAGLIDEARIYNHALTLSEVRFLFNEGAVVPEPATLGLLASGALGLVGLARLRRRQGR